MKTNLVYDGNGESMKMDFIIDIGIFYASYGFSTTTIQLETKLTVHISINTTLYNCD